MKGRSDRTPARREKRPAPSSDAERTVDDTAIGEFPPKWQWVLLTYFSLALAFFGVGFLPDRQIVGTDYIAAGHFISEFINAQFASGTLPKWIPYIFGGLPVYSNPGGMYYPTRLLLNLVLPAERTLVAVFVLQITIAGFSTYLFARALAVRWWVAGLAGLAYEFTGTIVSFVYAGHDGRAIAATSLPLVLLCVTRSVVTGRSLWFAALAASVGNLLLSFQIQAAYYVLLAAAAWGMFVVAEQWETLGSRRGASRMAMSVLAVALGFAIASVNFLPFSGYVAESPRANTSIRGYSFATSFSMPPAETIGLAVPEWQGTIDTYRGLSKFKYHTEYAGAFVLALIALSARFCWRNKRWRFFSGLAVFAVVMAWGGYTPLYRAYYELIPGVSRFRAPSIGLFLVSFSLVMLAAFGLEILAARKEHRPEERPRPPFLPVVGLSAGLLLLAAVGGGDERWLGVVRFAIFLGVVVGLVGAWFNGVGRPRWIVGALALIVVADLCVVGQGFVQTIDPPKVLLQPDDVAQFLIARKPSRIWVFPAPQGTGSGYLGNGTFGVSTDYLMHFGLRQMGGEHGNQLQRWNDYVGGSAERMIDWNHLTARTGLVDAASVDYIVATVLLDVVHGKDNKVTDRLVQVFQNGRVVIYQNTKSMPRAYLTPIAHLVATRKQALDGVLEELWDPHDSTVVEVARTESFPRLDRTPLVGSAIIGSSDDPNRLVVRTTSNRDATLVVTEAFAEGWQATIDGRRTAIWPANYAFRGVNVPAGEHVVTFEFKPPAVYAGLRMSIVSIVVLLGWVGAAATISIRNRRAA